MTSLPWDDDRTHEGLLARRSSTLCLSEREMDDFRRNCLSGVTREVVEEHLLFCPHCLGELEAEDEFARCFCAAARKLELAELEAQLSGPGPDSSMSLPDEAEPPEAPLLRQVLTPVDMPRRPSLWRRIRQWLMPEPLRLRLPSFAAACAVAVIGLWTFSRPDAAGPAVEVTLESYRGGGGLGASLAPAHRPLVLRPRLQHLPAAAEYRVFLVDAKGQLVTSRTLLSEGGTLAWALPGGLKPGRYWLRLADSSPEAHLLREFGLRVQ